MNIGISLKLRLSDLFLSCSRSGEDSEGSVASKECVTSFLRSPVEIMADKATGKVSGIRMEINKLEARVTRSKHF